MSSVYGSPCDVDDEECDVYRDEKGEDAFNHRWPSMDMSPGLTVASCMVSAAFSRAFSSFSASTVMIFRHVSSYSVMGSRVSVFDDFDVYKFEFVGLCLVLAALKTF